MKFSNLGMSLTAWLSHITYCLQASPKEISWTPPGRPTVPTRSICRFTFSYPCLLFPLMATPNHFLVNDCCENYTKRGGRSARIEKPCPNHLAPLTVSISSRICTPGPSMLPSTFELLLSFFVLLLVTIERNLHLRTKRSKEFANIRTKWREECSEIWL